MFSILTGICRDVMKCVDFVKGKPESGISRQIAASPYEIKCVSCFSRCTKSCRSCWTVSGVCYCRSETLRQITAFAKIGNQAFFRSVVTK